MISDAPVDILNEVVKVSGRQAAKLQHDNPSYSGLITMKRKNNNSTGLVPNSPSDTVTRQLLQVPGRLRGHPSVSQIWQPIPAETKDEVKNN
jgi:hypothetical protein